jgi:predicted transcriptional regulator
LKSKDGELNDIDEVRWWWQEVTRILHEELASSNFPEEVYEIFLDLGCFGTASMHEDEGEETALTFQTHHINEYCIWVNSRGKVDTHFRKFQYTARQAAQEWGEENLSQKVRDALKADEQKKQDEKFWFLHAIMPRDEYDPEKKANFGLDMPIASVYIEVESKHKVKEHGYEEMPKMTPRWAKGSGEIYGRSPGMSCLPEVKLVNRMAKDLIKAAEKKIDPPLVVPHDGFIGPAKVTPGSLLYKATTFGSQEKVQELMVGSDIGLGLEYEEAKRDPIRKAFWNHIFILLHQMTQKKGKVPTATQVRELIRERRMLLSTIGRLQSQLFNVVIYRSMGILGRMTKLDPATGYREPYLPPMPAVLEGRQYEVEYISQLALAMKMTEVQAVYDTMAYIAPYVERDETIMDNFDGDEIARGTAQTFGTKPAYIRSIEERDAIRAARAEREQAQALVEAAPDVAGAVQKLQKPTEAGSPLEQLIGMV